MRIYIADVPAIFLIFIGAISPPCPFLLHGFSFSCHGQNVNYCFVCCCRQCRALHGLTPRGDIVDKEARYFSKTIPGRRRQAATNGPNARSPRRYSIVEFLFVYIGRESNGIRRRLSDAGASARQIVLLLFLLGCLS